MPPDEVESGLTDLINELNKYDGFDVLNAAAYFHLRFEHIHPFADGNGRVGRTLLNYFLLIHGEPPVIVFDEDKKNYYDALETYDTKEEIEPLYAFLKEQTVKTWEKTYERSQNNDTKKRKSLKES